VIPRLDSDHNSTKKKNEHNLKAIITEITYTPPLYNSHTLWKNIMRVEIAIEFGHPWFL
jgi:hypothetical protein